ncbi:MAG: S46 family peptidase [Bacteroidetes bacterium]|nr:MAG: S46 family peptidase [Bacteroidota bacterium]TAG88642.1 MAG: S46 family peptidase [Bacteroidota bacterium]
MKKIFILLFVSLLSFKAMADEGMWLLMFLGKNYEQMKKQGFKLKPEDIYNVNKASLKDAIIQLRTNGRGFCTGEIISKEGLVLTNHHCAYDAIQSHSSTQNDRLTNGFWAKSKGEELANEGLEASILVRMEDVTARVIKELNDNMTEKERTKKANEILAQIKKEVEEAEKAKGNVNYEATVTTFFGGNQYYLLLHEIFKDVRLVGAPHESIGKFGGDTDNWMWPRHTGDFAMLRIYADKNNKPANYSKDNMPFKPRHHLPVSLGGIKEGDFSMVMGFPGRTDRFLTSYGVNQVISTINPSRVKLRDKRLQTWKEDMDKSADIRLRYASKYASIANYWKYFQGEAMILKRLNTAGQKKNIENNFQKWADADATRKAKYGNVLPELEKAYTSRGKYIIPREYLNEGLVAPEIVTFSAQAFGLLAALEGGSEPDIKKQANNFKANLGEHFKDYNMSTDQKVMANLYEIYINDVPAEFQPETIKEAKAKYGTMAKFAEELFKQSIFGDKVKLEAFLDKPSKEVLVNDMALKLFQNIRKTAMSYPTDFVEALDKNNRLFIAGILEMDTKKFYAPNANSTIRLTYGNVGSYTARDAVKYNFFTTLDGVMEKEDNTNPEFVVPKKLREVYDKKDFGRYAENGTIPLAFITNNDITGGNSGSPVINAKGEIIGCAFDGNWEAMSGNIAFEPNLQRCICVDIRYVLFTIEKVGGAKNLIDEMTIVNEKKGK